MHTPQPEYHVGFSGTREGMMGPQKEFISTALFSLMTNPDRNINNTTFWFHHGDCRGADDEACEMARSLGYKIWTHPPIDSTYQRVSKAFDAKDPKYSYQGRNHRICLKSQILLAAPLLNNNYGGTWSCINQARLLLKPILIAFHDGRWIEERVTNSLMLKYLESKHDGRIGDDK